MDYLFILAIFNGNVGLLLLLLCTAWVINEREIYHGSVKCKIRMSLSYCSFLVFSFGLIWILITARVIFTWLLKEDGLDFDAFTPVDSWLEMISA